MASRSNAPCGFKNSTRKATKSRTPCRKKTTFPPYGKKTEPTKKMAAAIELSRLGLLILRRIDVFNQLCEIIRVEH